MVRLFYFLQPHYCSINQLKKIHRNISQLRKVIFHINDLMLVCVVHNKIRLDNLVIKLFKATLKAVLSGLTIGLLIVILVPSLRPQISLNIEDWLLSINSQISFSTAIKKSAPAVVQYLFSYPTPYNP